MSSSTAMEAPAQVRLMELTASDRCDRCGAQAYVVAQFAGGDLLFCGHHFARHEVAVTAAALLVQDNRNKINARPSVAAY